MPRKMMFSVVPSTSRVPTEAGEPLAGDDVALNILRTAVNGVAFPDPGGICAKFWFEFPGFLRRPLIESIENGVASALGANPADPLADIFAFRSNASFTSNTSAHDDYEDEFGLTRGADRITLHTDVGGVSLAGPSFLCGAARLGTPQMCSIEGGASWPAR